ncbi:hypothetical protein PK35_16795 [Tamlana nanhaiensis]|uniref:Uncharacterized protein n=1 Tax=Neotamlana nanhaiensis TaxID=1382798 RepID=A0A0D7VW20_9FLAO|nr:hypothetical protein PK35_16795 [Tamlana nanhaiensis]
MKFKEIIQLLKIMPKRMILIIIIAIVTIIAVVNDIGIKSSLALIFLGIISYVIAKITWNDF